MIKLKDYSTDAPEGMDRDEAKAALKDIGKQIGELHYKMFAQKKHSLLVIFQGMDASGKDGAAKHVFKRCFPLGISVKGFGKPTKEEFAHDFLWRVHKEAPLKGNIKIFTRSHYEDILIQRVHQWIDEETVDQRVAAINAFESLLANDNHTTVLKFYLNISKERQEEKLQERIDIPEKNWKHNPGDWAERQHWDKYMNCYEEALNRCNVIPWHIVPADKRWYRNYFIANKILETMQQLDIDYPTVDKADLGKSV